MEERSQICTNYLEYEDAPYGPNNIIVRQKKNGGNLYIKCFNLKLEYLSRIHACGNEIGGNIIINVTNNLQIVNNITKIYSYSYHKNPKLLRKGGNITINVGNKIVFENETSVNNHFYNIFENFNISIQGKNIFETSERLYLPCDLLR